MVRSSALALLLSAACYSPEPAAGIACSPQGHCPIGQRCVNGTCDGVEPGDDARRPDTPPGFWWDPTFAARIPIDLDRYTPTAELGDFPLLVVLPMDFDKGLARSDLGDLRFVDDGGMVLAHELEAGVSTVAWVRIPKLSPGEHPVIWLYFGKPTATAQPAPVWSSPYIGVWHLGDTADSSAANNDGTLVAGTVVTGRIGRGVDFAAGSMGHVRIPDGSSLHWNGGSVTASGWEQLDSYQMGYSAVIARAQEVAAIWDDWFLGIGDQKVHGQMRVGTSGNGVLLTAGAAPLQTWVHIAFVFDGTTARLYRDGIQVASSPYSGSIGQSARPIYLGADNNSNTANPDTDFVDGTIDEVRLETVARPAAWMAADHASQTDAWTTFGTIETKP